MRAGRKSLKASSRKDCLCLQGGQSVMQVLSLRGSNIIEVLDAKGVKTLALFPVKFQKSFWIKRGNFVVVDESGRKQALESGGKVTCMVLQVLFHEQVRALQRSSEWPQTFKTASGDGSETKRQSPMAEPNAESDSENEDGLPLLEANVNRNRPVDLSSGSDADPD